MNYRFKRVSAMYTGGGIYVFFGILNDGYYFQTDDCFDGVRILSRSPFVDDNAVELDAIDDAFYPEWQTEYPYKDLDEKESLEFLKAMYTWMLNHPKDDDCENTKERLDEINKQIAEPTFTITCYGQTKTYKESERQKMIDFYLQGMMAADGSERERYTNIYLDLLNGYTKISDE